MTRDRALAFITAALCAATAGWLAYHERDEDRIRDANELGLSGRYDEAITTARPVTHAPSGGRAALVQAYAHEALGHHRLAIKAFEQAARRDPDNWQIRRDWARALLRSGDRRGALRQYARARRLNPALATQRRVR
jgi:Flp pilus assembly protein TadD